MTNEEAIYALDLVEHIESISVLYDPGEPMNQTTVRELKEACRVAVAALRAQQETAQLNMIGRGGCDYCKADSEGYSTCFRDESGRQRKIYIPEGEAAIVVPGRYNHKAYIKISYCPFCGRPLTEEAWADLERRINDGTADLCKASEQL